MKKIIILTAVATVATWGFFVPSFGSSGNSNGREDANFVRDNNKSIVTDIKNNKSYSDIINTNKYNYNQAIDYCQKLELSNAKDWRIPTKDELKSLFDFTNKPVNIKNKFINTQEGRYWSATKDRHEQAYYVDFDLGRYSVEKYNKNYYVMCIKDNK